MHYYHWLLTWLWSLYWKLIRFLSDNIGDNTLFWGKSQFYWVLIYDVMNLFHVSWLVYHQWMYFLFYSSIRKSPYLFYKNCEDIAMNSTKKTKLCRDASRMNESLFFEDYGKIKIPFTSAGVWRNRVRVKYLFFSYQESSPLHLVFMHSMFFVSKFRHGNRILTWQLVILFLFCI